MAVNNKAQTIASTASALRRPLALAAAIAAVCASLSLPAQAATVDDLLDRLKEKGILSDDEYQKLDQAREEEKKKQAEAKPADAQQGIRFKFGGFIEAAGIYRSRNETADVNSSFNAGMPLPNNPNYRLSEFRESARQSRLSALAEGDVDSNTALKAYFESDFLGAAGTANSGESNSYTPRIRHGYMTVDRYDYGFHFLAGQSWSLLTLQKVGITPRQEQIPLTIDAQYVPGFTWTRNPQLRVVKDFSKTVWLGFSVESPQASINSLNTPSNTTATNPAGSGGLLNPVGVNYSTDAQPDYVAKLAIDPGWGHYEVYGVARNFRDRSGFSNRSTWGGGAGAAAILPLVPERKLDFQLSFLTGKGIGRYGSAQLPDATFDASGDLVPIKESQLLLGLIARPTELWDIYLYGGLEKADATYSSSGSTQFGYGNPNAINTGCFDEAGTVSAIANCRADTKQVRQLTLGTWYRFYKGNYGTAVFGMQYSYTGRETFEAVGGAPYANENIVMTSFRLYF
ncbi:MAG TPA: hypothetical protein VFB20_04195 [Burkholderiales bacterium]|nr:hypothetical protein [Burkholderiales bacterium]